MSRPPRQFEPGDKALDSGGAPITSTAPSYKPPSNRFLRPCKNFRKLRNSQCRTSRRCSGRCTFGEARYTARIPRLCSDWGPDRASHTPRSGTDFRRDSCRFRHTKHSLSCTSICHWCTSHRSPFPPCRECPRSENRTAASVRGGSRNPCSFESSHPRSPSATSVGGRLEPPRYPKSRRGSLEPRWHPMAPAPSSPSRLSLIHISEPTRPY